MKLDTSKLHLDILDKTRQDLLKKIMPVAKYFVLGGGTALSLQIAHRKSFDFDFFSEIEIAKDLKEKIVKKITIEEITVDTGDEFTFYSTDKVKFTFLFYYYRSYFDIFEFKNGLKIFSVKEIAVKKAYTIGHRGVYRDYFDLFTIFKGKYINLYEIITGAESVYKGLFNSKLFLEQLVYFKDLPDFDITSINNQQIPSKDEVKQFLEEEVRKYLKS